MTDRGVGSSTIEFCEEVASDRVTARLDRQVSTQILVKAAGASLHVGAGTARKVVTIQASVDDTPTSINRLVCADVTLTAREGLHVGPRAGHHVITEYAPTDTRPVQRAAGVRQEVLAGSVVGAAG